MTNVRLLRRTAETYFMFRIHSGRRSSGATVPPGYEPVDQRPKSTSQLDVSHGTQRADRLSLSTSRGVRCPLPSTVPNRVCIPRFVDGAVSKNKHLTDRWRAALPRGEKCAPGACLAPPDTHYPSVPLPSRICTARLAACLHLRRSRGCPR